jgi:hypothetical protein
MILASSSNSTGKNIVVIIYRLGIHVILTRQPFMANFTGYIRIEDLDSLPLQSSFLITQVSDQVQTAQSHNHQSLM